MFRWPFRLRNRWTVDEMRLDLAEIRSTVLLPLAVIAEVEDNLTATGGVGPIVQRSRALSLCELSRSSIAGGKCWLCRWLPERSDGGARARFGLDWC